MSLTPLQIAWFRLRRSGLVHPFPSPETVARRLAGVQAQILPAAFLALWNRTGSLTLRQCENLLYRDRTLVKIWGQRNTLHLYPSEEWPLISGALAEQKTRWEQYFVSKGGIWPRTTPTWIGLPGKCETGRPSGAPTCRPP